MNNKINNKNVLVLNGESLSFNDLEQHLLMPGGTIELRKYAWKRIKNSSDFFDELQNKGTPCYGINTGLGELAQIRIPQQYHNQIQKRLILSHAVGANDPLSQKLSRSIFLIRINCLAKGASGIKLSTMEKLLILYNNEAYPEIYIAGSLGASGDLAPLSHLAAFIIGEGWGYLHGKRLRSQTIFKKLDIKPVSLQRKEGLSLINGTSAMVAIGVEAVARIKIYLETMLVGMSLILNCTQVPLDFLMPQAFKLKNHKGVIWIVKYINKLFENKELDKTDYHQNIQAPYSIRCVPFILGPLVESIRSAIDTLEIEMNSANDNPIFIDELRKVYHGGHFHGHPVSVELDKFRIAVVHLSGVIDRQLEFIMDKKRNSSVNYFLAIDPEKGHCGLEGVQYLVTSLHIENKSLSNPFSPQTLPTNAGNQDYVSLGMQSALSTLKMAENLKTIIAIYLFASMQAYHISNKPSKSKKLFKLYSFLTEYFGGPYKDNSLLREKVIEKANDEIYVEFCNLASKLFPSG